MGISLYITEVGTVGGGWTEYNSGFLADILTRADNNFIMNTVDNDWIEYGFTGARPNLNSIKSGATITVNMYIHTQAIFSTTYARLKLKYGTSETAVVNTSSVNTDRRTLVTAILPVTTWNNVDPNDFKLLIAKGGDKIYIDYIDVILDFTPSTPTISSYGTMAVIGLHSRAVNWGISFSTSNNTPDSGDQYYSLWHPLGDLFLERSDDSGVTWETAYYNSQANDETYEYETDSTVKPNIITDALDPIINGIYTWRFKYRCYGTWSDLVSTNNIAITLTPTAPTVVCTDAENGNLEYVWTPLLGLGNYAFKVDNGGDVLKTYLGSSTGVTIGSLSNDTTYIGALYTKISSYYSIPSYTSSTTVYLTPIPPALISLTKPYTDGIQETLRLTWVPGSYCGIQYIIYMSKDNAAYVSCGIIATGTLTTSMFNLDGNNSYKFKIVCINNKTGGGTLTSDYSDPSNTLVILRYSKQLDAGDEFTVNYNASLGGYTDVFNNSFDVSVIGSLPLNIKSGTLLGTVLRTLNLYDAISGGNLIGTITADGTIQSITVPLNGVYYLEYVVTNTYNGAESSSIVVSWVITSVLRQRVRVANGWQGNVNKVDNPDMVNNKSYLYIKSVGNIVDNDLAD